MASVAGQCASAWRRCSPKAEVPFSLVRKMCAALSTFIIIILYPEVRDPWRKHWFVRVSNLALLKPVPGSMWVYVARNEDQSHVALLSRVLVEIRPMFLLDHLTPFIFDRCLRAIENNVTALLRYNRVLGISTRVRYQLVR